MDLKSPTPTIFFNPKLQEFINNKNNLAPAYSDKDRKSSRDHYHKNRDYYIEYKKAKRLKDLQYKTYDSALGMLRRVIYASKKGYYIETDYFFETFGYYKYQFLNKITQDFNLSNYGKEWHIDHILSYRHFDFISYDCPGFKLAFGLDNLRGLDKKTNQSRSKMNRF